MADATVNRLVCPIGLTTIQDKAPAAIAASVAAQVLIARETPRRGRRMAISPRVGCAMADAGSPRHPIRNPAAAGRTPAA